MRSVPYQLMDAVDVLIQAMAIFFGNWMAIVPIILLTQLSLLFLHFLTTIPFPTKTPPLNILISMDQSKPKFLQITREFIGVVFTGLILSYILLSFFSAAMAHVSASAYVGKTATLKDVMRRIKSTWEGTLLTRLYILVLEMGLLTSFLSLFALITFVSDGTTILPLVIAREYLILVGIFLAVFLDAVLSVGTVASTLEKGCSGLRELGRVEELVSGREPEVFSVGAALWSTAGYSLWICSLVGGEEGLGLGFGALMVLYAFMHVAYTVMYCNYVEAEEVEWERGHRYWTSIEC